MKLTNKQLRQIIKEELEAVLEYETLAEGGFGTKVDGHDVYFTLNYEPKTGPTGNTTGVGTLSIDITIGDKKIADDLMILNDAGQGKEQEIKQKLQSGDLGMWNNIWKLGKNRRLLFLIIQSKKSRSPSTCNVKIKVRLIGEQFLTI